VLAVPKNNTALLHEIDQKLLFNGFT